jgi:hypothetical protein
MITIHLFSPEATVIIKITSDDVTVAVEPPP